MIKSPFVKLDLKKSMRTVLGVSPDWEEGRRRERSRADPGLNVNG